MDETVLISQCLEGNRKAQQKLYEYFAPKMMGVCIRYAGDRDRANDMLQEGFVKVFTKLGDYTGAGSFEGWMRKIFINCALEKIRKDKITSFFPDTEIDPEDTTPSALEELTASEMLEMVRCLPPGYRTIFNLFAIEGFSHKEIGEMLRITEGTSRSQYARARQYLQKMIKKMYSYG